MKTLDKQEGANSREILKSQTLAAKTDRHVTIDNLPDINLHMNDVEHNKSDNEVLDIIDSEEDEK